MPLPGTRESANSPFMGPVPPVVGRLVDVDEHGRARVDWPGNEAGPVFAPSLVQLDAAPSSSEPVAVLVCFVGDAASPIIVGIVHERLVHPTATVADPAGAQAAVDGRVVSLTGTERVELRCGEGSIVMTADGRIVVKGVQLVSRARETHKIRGASVLIN